MKKLIIIVCSISVLFSATMLTTSIAKEDATANYFYCEGPDLDELPFANGAI